MNPISSLTEQFKPYLGWHKSHLDALSILIIAITKRRTVNWTELATTFPGTTETSSCYRRIQRFFKGVVFEERVVAQLIAHLFAPDGSWMLSMDRTNWMFGTFKINILYLAINYKGMAIPHTLDIATQKGLLKHSGANRSAGTIYKNISRAAHTTVTSRQGVQRESMDKIPDFP